MAHSTTGKRLGQALRIYYDGITSEPLPAQLVHLIDRLNDKERAGREAGEAKQSERANTGRLRSAKPAASKPSA
jgi:hypothetical protein